MIAFGCSIMLPQVYETCARPGIERASEPDSPVLADSGAGSVARSYNLILEQAAAMKDLEALVLVHEDAEILDEAFCEGLRDALRDPDVAVVGCVGAVGVRSIAWWEGSITWASSTYHYGELGGGEISLLGRNGRAGTVRTGEVDTVAGVLMALSPWAVRNLRFDESLGTLHGYDFDICQQARAAGRKVVSADLRVAHHHVLQLVTAPEPWAAAHARTAEKWEGRFPGAASETEDWKARARRAEAEAAATRLLAASRLLQAHAHARAYEERIEQVTRTRSWRVTAPLRRLNAARKARRAQAAPEAGAQS